jgi:acylphosphatase
MPGISRKAKANSFARFSPACDSRPFMTAKRIIFEGRVQGVGFRYQTKQIAMGFEVTGWVRNMEDGRVEMEVMGPADEVEEFLAAIEDSDLNGLIRNREISEIPLLTGIRGFEIRR